MLLAVNMLFAILMFDAMCCQQVHSARILALVSMPLCTYAAQFCDAVSACHVEAYTVLCLAQQHPRLTSVAAVREWYSYLHVHVDIVVYDGQELIVPSVLDW